MGRPKKRKLTKEQEAYELERYKSLKSSLQFENLVPEDFNLVDFNNTKKRKSIKLKQVTKDEGEMIMSIGAILNSNSATEKSDIIRDNQRNTSKSNEIIHIANSNGLDYNSENRIVENVSTASVFKKKTSSYVENKEHSDYESNDTFDKLVSKLSVLSDNDPYKFKASPVEVLRSSQVHGSVEEHNFKTLSNMIPSDSENPVLFYESESDCDEISESVKALRFYTESDKCIALFKSPSKVLFSGKIIASALRGNVRVMGHRLTPTPRELYGVTYAGMMCFDVVAETAADGIDRSVFENVGLSRSFVDGVMEDVHSDDAVLLMEPLKNKFTDFVTRHISDKVSNLFSKKENSDADFVVFDCAFYDSKDCGRYMWDEEIDKVVLNKEGLPDTVTLICGGKNVGKSTALRVLTNKLLENGPVLVLDLDPGQPEFTACGLISATLVNKPLLGTNFTHMMETERSLYLGMINVTENIDRYMNSVCDLVNFCRGSDKYKNVPWLVNTMGFSTDLGLKLIVSVINIFKPNAVLEIFSSKSANNFNQQLDCDSVNAFFKSDEFLSWTSVETADQSYNHYPFQCFDAVSPPEKRRSVSNVSAKTERLLNVISYFSQIPSIRNSSVLEVVPYSVSLNKIKLLFNDLPVDSSFISSIINGRIVGLCKLGNTDSVNVSVHDNSPVVALGFGLVRGVDPETNKIYVLTPLGADRLAEVDVLSYAETLPECCVALSVPNLPVNTPVPYAEHRDFGSNIKNAHLSKTVRRKFNLLRLTDMNRKR